MQQNNTDEFTSGDIADPWLEGSGDPLAITETAREQAATDRNAFEQTATGREMPDNWEFGPYAHEIRNLPLARNCDLKTARHRRRINRRKSLF